MVKKPKENSTDSMSEVLAAIANPVRRKLLERLADGEANVSELAGLTSISMPAISRHLSTLEDVGLIARSKDGRQNFCRLETKPLKGVLEWLDNFKPVWELQPDKLNEYLNILKKGR